MVYWNSAGKESTMNKYISEKWLFVPGDRTGADAENGIPFRLDSSGFIDLDRLRETPFRAEEDGTAYNRFHLDRDTELGFGMGCDWWAEVRLNGQVIYTTFPDGNASPCFDVDNHCFTGRGRKGENLLTVRVRRGTGSWSFAFGEKEIAEIEPCLPLEITGDPGRFMGAIKPMNAVNNGPVRGRRSNAGPWEKAAIPFARNHDAAFYSGYGGEHVVDVHAVFPNFDADPDDPAAYDFLLTDQYLRSIQSAGTQIFYRLGSKIEHKIKKYGTKVPADFHKWAVICEHIIRHYNEGWADGSHMNIRYWEIWNEPDLDADDAANKRTWQGTEKQFFDFYRTAACHLKKCFPELKIGGPALSGKLPWMKRFLKAMSEGEPVPLDFFSWHLYGNQPNAFRSCMRAVRRILDEFGYDKTESILNEWNYIRNWTGEGFRKTVQTITGLKGAVFASSVMCTGQNSPLDMLMYYDARPCTFNGIFSFYTQEPLKGYYAFLAWSKLAKLGTQFFLDTHRKNGIFAVGATDKKGRAAILINRYFEPDQLPDGLKLSVKLTDRTMRDAAVYLLDENHDLEPIPCRADPEGKLELDMEANTMVYIEFNC